MKKNDLVAKIEKTILNNGEEVYSSDLDHAPILTSTKDTIQFIEIFNHDSATVFTYFNDIKICKCEMLYKNMPKKILEEISTILDDHLQS